LIDIDIDVMSVALQTSRRLSITCVRMRSGRRLSARSVELRKSETTTMLRSELSTSTTTDNLSTGSIARTRFHQIYYLLLYLWSKCAAVIGSNRVTWYKLIWGIDRFTGSPVNMSTHIDRWTAEPVNTPY